MLNGSSKVSIKLIFLYTSNNVLPITTSYAIHLLTAQTRTHQAWIQTDIGLKGKRIFSIQAL